MEIHEYINTSPKLKELFKGISKEDLNYFELVFLKPDDYLLNKHGTTGYLYFITKGICGIFHELENGEQYCTYKIVPYNIIGLSEMIPGEIDTRIANVIALSDLVTIRIKKVFFTKIKVKYIDFYDKCVRLVIHRLHNDLSMHIECKKYSSMLNVVSYLIYTYNLYVYVSTNHDDLVYISETRQMIADYTGLSKRSVNSTFEKLKLLGLVEIIKGKIYISKYQYEKLLEYKDENI